MGKASKDIRFFQARIFLENLFHCHFAGQEIQDQRDPNAVSPNARLAETYIGIDGNPSEQVLSIHWHYPSRSITLSYSFPSSSLGMHLAAKLQLGESQASKVYPHQKC